MMTIRQDPHAVSPAAPVTTVATAPTTSRPPDPDPHRVGTAGDPVPRSPVLGDRPLADEVGDRLEGLVGLLRSLRNDRVDEFIRNAERTIVDRPLVALGAAVVTGYLVGRLLRRR